MNPLKQLLSFHLARSRVFLKDTQRVLFVYLSSLCCCREGWLGIRAEIGWVGKSRQKKETIFSVVRKLVLGENAEAWSRDWSECDGKVTNVGGRSKWQAWRGYYTEWRHPPPHPSSSLSFIFPSFKKFALNLKDQCDELMHHRAGRDQWFIHLVPHFYTITTCLQLPFSLPTFHFALLFPEGSLIFSWPLPLFALECPFPS